MAKYSTEIKLYNPKDEANLFNRGDKYYIPLYQRAYAWTEKQINQLIEDIYDYSGDNYYIGSLVVYRRAGNYEVIDGQQRLTTLLLLFIYLKFKVDNCLIFDCRKKSNMTLGSLIDGTILYMNDEDIESSLAIGEKIIEEKFSTSNNGYNIDIDKFLEKLSRVVLYRIEVPQGTDLNRYFEVMNTRGEQLEQHEILKARFMEQIKDPSDREMFAKVWTACREMNGYVQMNLADTNLRRQLFSDDWVNLQSITFNSPQEKTNKSFDKVNQVDFNNRLEMILECKPSYMEKGNEHGERIRFESVIDFPHFLLHVLKVFKEVNHIDDFSVGTLLDDTLLLESYKLLFKSEKAKQLNLSMHFINCLLKCRILFDKYILKREFSILDNEGKWSLKQINKSENDSPYYTRTFKSDNAMMLEAAMRVSYTSPKVMHWITHLLLWLYSNDQDVNSSTEFEHIMKKYIHKSIAENFFTHDNYERMGIDTPHIVLNYLDYLLWNETPDKYIDFVFEFRNTIEHWYPQHPSVGMFEEWEQKDVDHFGNLCLLQRNYNSKFSNLEPHSKKASYVNMIAKGSIKLRIMSELTTEDTDWKNLYRPFGEQMLGKLKDAVLKNDDLGVN